MISVSNDFKTRTKKIKQQNIKLSIVDGELTVKEVHFMTVKEFNALPVWMLRKRQEVIAKELKYSFEGNLFKTIMKQIEITVKNAGELKDKNVNFQYGIYVNNDFEYIDLGDYYIKDIEDDKGKAELVVTGYDKMINFMRTFKQSELQLTYPCTILTLIQKMCEVCGVELYSTNFFNADLQVDEDYFTAQELTYRDVLKKVAESTETTIFIKDNKLYLHKLADSAVEKLDASYLTGLTVKEKFGPVNALVLGRGDVEDNVEAKDNTSITQNGRCEIRFDENEFVEYQREQVIDEMFEQIKGLEYYAFEGSDVGVMWLEPCDLIEVEDNEESTYKTIYLKANITINTGISSDIEADIPEETNTEYKVTTKEEKKTLKVERLAKKNEGQIQDLIQETSEQGQKITEVEQTVDGITQTVSSIETKVETVEDKADSAQEVADNATKQIETTTKKLSQIEQTVDNITQTVSSVETKVETVEGKADNAQETANSAYSLADDAISSITSVNKQMSQIEQTVDGITQSVSEVEEKVITVESTANKAQTTANTANTNAQKAQSTADATNGNLATNYYTKTETNSQIKQKADSITSSVSKTYSTKSETTDAKNDAINSANASTDKKLENYSTTSQMNSIITQTAESINSVVSKKVGKDELCSTISQSADEISIKGNRFLLESDNLKIAKNGIMNLYGSDDGEKLPSFSIKASENENIETLLRPSSFQMIKGDGNATTISNYSTYSIIQTVTGNNKITISTSNTLDDSRIQLAGATKSTEITQKDITTGKVKITDEGTVMYGMEDGHKYRCNWTNTELQFWVDLTNVGTLSDKRLKTDIKGIDDDFINAIEEIEMKQFKVANRNGLVSFGILAQDLMEIFEKYNKNPFDYEIVYETKYRTDDDTVYYAINYTQFLVLKQKATDVKLKKLEQENKEKDKLLKELIARIEKLEGGNNE